MVSLSGTATSLLPNSPIKAKRSLRSNTTTAITTRRKAEVCAKVSCERQLASPTSAQTSKREQDNPLRERMETPSVKRERTAASNLNNIEPPPKRKRVTFECPPDNDIHKMERNKTKNTVPSIGQRQLQRRRSRSRMDSIRRKNRSQIKLMLAAIFFILLCYIPYVLTVNLYTFCPNHCGVRQSYVKYAATLSIIHGLFNIVLYIIKEKHFRRGIITIVWRRR